MKACMGSDMTQIRTSRTAPVVLDHWFTYRLHGSNRTVAIFRYLGSWTLYQALRVKNGRVYDSGQYAILEDLIVSLAANEVTWLPAVISTNIVRLPLKKRRTNHQCRP